MATGEGLAPHPSVYRGVILGYTPPCKAHPLRRLQKTKEVIIQFKNKTIEKKTFQKKDYNQF